jgi:tRNA threonylcarbamoyl adenosine modification protein YjeE
MTDIVQTTTDESRTHDLGVALGQALRAGDVVELIGELGAGKTRLARGIAQGAGHDPDTVSSPTYVLFNEYRSPNAKTILHIDAYRVASPDELEDAGYDHASMDAIVLIEWADRLAGALDSGALRIEIEHAPDRDDTTRVFRFTCTEPLRTRLKQAFKSSQTP